MNNFVSKLSLYDILAMVIPGGTILLFLSKLFGCQWKVDTNFVSEELGWCFCLVLAYIVGIVNHVFSSSMCGMFRNNPLLLEETFSEAVKHDCFNWLEHLYPAWKRTTPDGIKSDMFWHVALSCTIIIVAFGCLTNILFLCFSKEDEVIAIFVAVIAYTLICWLASYALNQAFKSDFSRHPITQAYYDAYYLVTKHRYGEDISIMEGQVAFMQSMALPLSLFVAWPNSLWESLGLIGCARICTAKLTLILLCIAVCYCVYERIKKIHLRVWEDYEFLKALENSKSIKQ